MEWISEPHFLNREMGFCLSREPAGERISSSNLTDQGYLNCINFRMYKTDYIAYFKQAILPV